MLEIRNLCVAVEDHHILKDLTLSLPAGELHVLLGPNGCGKSSLLAAIMGLPPFEVTAGDILFEGKPIQRLSIRERALLGIGIAYQRPPSLDGLTVRRFAQALGAEDRLDREATALDLQAFLARDMNVGFSGGEIKRWEVLKLVLQDARLMLFDEPESGVDLEHVKAIGAAIAGQMQRPHSSGQPRGGLVITHTGMILNDVAADRAHIMQDGRIVHSGAPKELFAHIQAHGYRAPDAA